MNVIISLSNIFFLFLFQNSNSLNIYLVGGFNPFEKYARQIGSFPQGSGVKI